MNILNPIKAIGQVLLTGISDLIGKFKGDPTRLAELEQEAQKLVLEHNVKIQEIALNELETSLKDKKNARQREISLRNTLGIWVQNIAAILIIMAFIGLMYAVYFADGNDENKGILNIMIGALGTIVVNIFGYWFGSSQGSAKKDNQMNQFMERLK